MFMKVVLGSKGQLSLFLSYYFPEKQLLIDDVLDSYINGGVLNHEDNLEESLRILVFWE